MASDREGSLLAAEKLLKQGKVRQAVDQLKRLADLPGLDPLILNRMGDLLARQGLNDEAAGFYVRIANLFTRQGFYPKAIAIHKKILRVDPGAVDSLAHLGDLYANMKIPGEARTFYMRAADELLRKSDFIAAQDVYERLVAVEPDNPRHRARLAETRAASGDAAGASRELAVLGDSLFHAGNPEDAEKAYRRAAELTPGSPPVLVGIANCLAEQGQVGEAQRLLEQAARNPEAGSEVRGQLWLRHELGGQGDRALDLVAGDGAAAIPADVFRKAVAHHAGSGTADNFWARYDPVLETNVHSGRGQLVAEWLTAAADAEEAGHIGALERLERHLEAAGNTYLRVAALERLAEAYGQCARPQDAEDVRHKLEAMAPAGGRVAVAEHESDPGQPARPEDIGPPRNPLPGAESRTVLPPVMGDARDLPKEIEAPAVPLSRADEEFASGRLTQSEILEKYGLNDQALQQVVEVTTRFPGDERGQERLVQLLRTFERPSQLCRALVGLAIARRASGNLEGAAASADEASLLRSFTDADRELMVRLGLLQAALVVSPAPRHAAAKPRAPLAGKRADDVILIDFDAEEADASTAEGTAAEPAEREPADELLAEIGQCLDGDDVGQAEQKAAALRVLGYGGERLAGLETRIASALASRSAARDEADDDLDTITAALESELFDDPGVLHAPAAESEESLEEVFAKFREQVEQQVADEDFRTHYDLGIAYKEMGLVAEAIDEFGIALGSPDLARDASTMLAMCHRERQEIGEAVRYYRQALDATDGDAAITNGLRYDLADTLLEEGDREGALDMFRDVMAANPGFRDVRDRVAEIESGG